MNVEDLVKESTCSGKVKVGGVEDLVKESTLTFDPSSRSRGRPADDEVSMDPAFLLPLSMLSAFLSALSMLSAFLFALSMLSAFLLPLSETNRFFQLASRRFFSLFSPFGLLGAGESW